MKETEKTTKTQPLYGVLPHYGASTVRHAPRLAESQRSFTRKLDQQLANSIIQKVDEAFAEAYILICQPNDLAIFAVTDAVEKLKEAGMWRQGVKHHAGRALSYIHEYEEALEATTKRSGTFQYFLDMSDCFYEEMQPVMFRFRMAIKNWLDRQGEPQSDVKSYVLWARSLLWCVVAQWDTYWERKRKELGGDVDPSRHFRAARLSGVLTAWDKAGDCIHWENPGEMYADPQVDMGMKSILLQINNRERINRCGKNALDMNPDRKAHSKRLERQRIKDMKNKEKTIW